MRVTKTIREYIEDSVKTTITKTTPMPNMKVYEEMHNKVNQFVNDLDAQIDAYVEAQIQQFRIDNNIPDDVELKHSSYTAVRWSTFGSAMHQAAKAEERARNKRIEDAIKDIILDLELGGTRADLERNCPHCTANLDIRRV